MVQNLRNSFSFFRGIFSHGGSFFHRTTKLVLDSEFTFFNVSRTQVDVTRRGLAWFGVAVAARNLDSAMSHLFRERRKAAAVL